MNEAQIKKFQQIFKEAHGRDITADEALKLSTQLIALFEVLLQVEQKPN